MKLQDFDYYLPEELIAQTPLEKRDESRFLMLDKNSGKISHKIFKNITQYLWENDVLVLNKTSVINARLFGEMDIFPNGIQETKNVEIFLHWQISLDTWECLGYPGKNLKIGRIIRFYDENKNIIMTWEILKVSEMGRYIKFSKSGFDFFETIEKLWELPLPPYITQKLDDPSRYQTVFHETPGSAAAPTAGLHFTEELLETLEKKWVKIEKVLLHVWVGTFKPVEAENILDHYMHSEFIQIEKETADRLNEYKKQWKNIIAVGTTCVRTLESFSDENGILWYGEKSTSIFIYPWYKWKFVSSLITNFHLPQSTLLMLVSSLAGRENILNAYQTAVKEKYRFFSFGDAMWIK